MVRCVAVIDEASDNHRIRERDDDLQCAGSRIRCRRHREGIPQAALAPAYAVDLGDQERRLMNTEAMVLLVAVDDGPFLGIAEPYDLIDPVLVHNPSIDEKGLAIGRARVFDGATSSDWGGPHLIDPGRALEVLGHDLRLEHGLRNVWAS